MFFSFLLCSSLLCLFSFFSHLLLFPEGFTLLHYAAKRPNLPLVRMLVSRGANVNRPAVNDICERPLQCAIEGGDLALVDFLVQQGADMHAGNFKVWFLCLFCLI